MMGKMAEEMQEDEPDSPLKVKLAKLAKQISTFGYIGAIIIALFYLAHAIMVFDGGAAGYFAQPIPDIIMNVVDAVSLCSRDYRLCGAGGASADDFACAHAEYKQDA